MGNIEKSSPDLQNVNKPGQSAKQKIKATFQSLFPKTRAVEAKPSVSDEILVRTQADPMDETEDWIIEDNRLIKPSKDTT